MVTTCKNCFRPIRKTAQGGTWVHKFEGAVLCGIGSLTVAEPAPKPKPEKK